MSISLDPIIQSGVLGAILAWFMLRLEGIIKENTKAINEMQLVIAKLCLTVGDNDVKKSELS